MAEIQKAIALGYDGSFLDLVWVYMVSGERDKTEALLREIEQRARERYVSNVTLAMAYASAEHRDQALEFLEKAVAERSNELRINLPMPQFDSLRADPKFQKILKIVGITK
jgi:predicted nucleic acid-binding protein